MRGKTFAFLFNTFWFAKQKSPEIYIVFIVSRDWNTVLCFKSVSCTNTRKAVAVPPLMGTMLKLKATKSRWIPSKHFTLLKKIPSRWQISVMFRSHRRLDYGPIRAQNHNRNHWSEVVRVPLKVPIPGAFIKKHNGLPLLRRNTRKLISKWLP